MPRVYLIYRNRMFADVICAVLDIHPEIELVGMTDNPDQVASDVVALTPDVILLEETDEGPVVDNVRVLLTSPIPYRLITLQPDADGMHVWSQTWCQTVRTQDLVDAIVTAGTRKPGEDRE